MAENPALLTHVLRRLTFGTSPGQLASYGEASAADVIRTLLDAPPLEPELPELGTNDDYETLTRWWAGVMADPAAGLHERMVWFWHGHLTSSLEKAEPAHMLRQHRLLHSPVDHHPTRLACCWDYPRCPLYRDGAWCSPKSSLADS